MVGALLSFSVMAVSIRLLASRGFGIFEILAMRSALALVILFALMAVRPELRNALRPKRFRLHLLRNTIHYVSQYMWAVSLTLLPLAMVFSLEFTMPAWTALFRPSDRPADSIESIEARAHARFDAFLAIYGAPPITESPPART